MSIRSVELDCISGFLFTENMSSNSSILSFPEPTNAVRISFSVKLWSYLEPFLLFLLYSTSGGFNESRSFCKCVWNKHLFNSIKVITIYALVGWALKDCLFYIGWRGWRSTSNLSLLCCKCAWSKHLVIQLMYLWFMPWWAELWRCTVVVLC